MKYIFFSILTALAFYQCQEPAPAPKNILHCYVRYDAAGRNVKAEATLYDGSNKKVVEIPGGIRFQSTQMNAFPVRGITYSVEYPAAYLAETGFEWNNVDKAKGKGEFKAKIPSIDSFFFDKPVLSVKESANLQWLGKPLGKNETLVFIWENMANGTTIPMEVSTILGAPLIEIPAAKMAQVGPGDWTLYLVRKRTEKAETNDYFIESATEYYTKTKTVKVTGDK